MFSFLHSISLISPRPVVSMYTVVSLWKWTNWGWFFTKRILLEEWHIQYPFTSILKAEWNQWHFVTKILTYSEKKCSSDWEKLFKVEAEGWEFAIYSNCKRSKQFLAKFIYSEKATKFCEILTLLLSCVVPVKSKVKILQNFLAFSEYMNFIRYEKKFIYFFD